jgi:hypothetical protein
MGRSYRMKALLWFLCDVLPNLFLTLNSQQNNQKFRFDRTRGNSSVHIIVLRSGNKTSIAKLCRPIKCPTNISGTNERIFQKYRPCFTLVCVKSSKMEETGSLVNCFECKMGFTKFSYQKTISLTVSCWICWISRRNPLSHRSFHNYGSRQPYVVTKRLWNLCRTWHYLPKVPKGNLTTDFS